MFGRGGRSWFCGIVRRGKSYFFEAVTQFVFMSGQ
jgi:hypothetical protein